MFDWPDWILIKKITAHDTTGPTFCRRTHKSQLGTRCTYQQKQEQKSVFDDAFMDIWMTMNLQRKQRLPHVWSRAYITNANCRQCSVRTRVLLAPRPVHILFSSWSVAAVGPTRKWRRDVCSQLLQTRFPLTRRLCWKVRSVGKACGVSHAHTHARTHTHTHTPTHPHTSLALGVE